jgi:hypothetical protein
MNEPHGMYMISVHPTRVNYYYEPLNRQVSHSKSFYNDQTISDPSEGSDGFTNPVATIRPSQFKDNYHHGKISKTAERKITRAIDYLVYMAQPKKLPHTKHGKGLFFRLNFVTLTLSSEQIHSDHEISYHIFHPFLVSLTREFKIKRYIWRAERQENGGLHYHLITDRFIPWQRLRELWNNAQQHLGYVTRYRENQLAWHSGGFRPRPELYKNWPLKKQYKAWQEGCRHDWNSPNSTDVHSLILINNVKAYFKKYMTKEGQNSDIKGRLWGCSQTLSNLKGGQSAVYSKIDDDLGKLESDKSLKKFSTDYFTTILVTPADLARLGCHEMLDVFFGYLTKQFPEFSPPLRFPS